MFRDGRTVPNDTALNADICVLGAGAAGLSFVKEFLDGDARIAVIESGGMDFDGAVQELYEGAAGSPEISAMRQRFFGGSTNCWMGRCRPLDDVDFQARDWVGNSGWPISLGDLEDYYRRASVLLGLGSYDQFYNRNWDSRLYPGQFFARLNSTGSRVQGWPFAQVPETHLRFGPVFSKSLRNSKNVTVYLNSNIVSLRSAGGEIEGADIKTLSGNRISVRASIFVLALGGLENPRILLLSDAAEPNGLGNRNDLVGRYFMGHPQTETGEMIYAPADWCYPKEEIAAPGGQLFFRLSDAVQRSEQILNAGFWVYREISGGEEAFRVLRRDLIAGRMPDSVGEKLLEIMGNLGDVGQTLFCNIQYQRKRADKWKFWVQTEQEPDSENRVRLDPELDALGLRKIRVSRRYSELDRLTALRSSEIFAAELTRFGLGRVKLDDRYKDYSLFTGEQDGTFGHDMGTTRMSSSAKTGVVDGNCRVHGIGNLYIGGSSVFPTSGFANPTLTIIALAIRIADTVKARLGRAR